MSKDMSIKEYQPGTKSIFILIWVLMLFIHKYFQLHQDIFQPIVLSLWIAHCKNIPPNLMIYKEWSSFCEDMPLIQWFLSRFAIAPNSLSICLSIFCSEFIVNFLLFSKFFTLCSPRYHVFSSYPQAYYFFPSVAVDSNEGLLPYPVATLVHRI